jgi:hypothetical protein
VRRLIPALALVALLGLAQPASAELKAIWGPDELADGRSAFPVYDKLGVDVLERQLVWSRVALRRPANPRNPKDRAYHWPTELGRAIALSHRHGIRVALLVRGTPRWANGGHAETVRPSNPGDYADFMIAAARHYTRVNQWMVWGEPQRDGTFEPFDPAAPDGPRAYAVLLDRAYGALKSVRRSIKVIGGMTLTYDAMPPTRFLQWMRLPNGKPPRLDWFGHNPYSTRYPNLRGKPYAPGLRDMSDLDTYIGEVRRTYRAIHRSPRLWLSEFSVSSDRANRAFSFSVSRKAQARWLTAAYRIAHRNGYIAGLGWYDLQDEKANRGLTLGLLDTAGRPKPSYYAYKRAR